MTVDELKALTADKHFDCIITDHNDQVLFAVPVPGHPELEYIKLDNGGVRLITDTGDEDDFTVWERAWDEYIRDLIEKTDTKPAGKIPRRSRKQAEAAGAIVKMPKKLALPTLVPYQNAISTVENPAAYLQPITKELVDRLRFENGRLFFEGMDAGAIDLIQYYDKTPQAVSNLDLPTLRALYSIILQDLTDMLKDVETIAAKSRDPQYLGHSVKIYLADFLRMLGYKSNTSKAATNYAVAKIMSFNSVLGLMEENIRGRTYHSKYPVMVFMGYDDTNGTLSFASPYINKIIMDIAQARINKDKNRKHKLHHGVEQDTLPAHSFLVDTDLVKEKNRRAVEIVCVVTTLLEQCGNNLPHIRASTIVDRVPDLKFAVENATTSSNKNLILKRAFSKAWDLLREYPFLQEKYKNIKLPTAIPTAASLDMVFEFPHDGKND